MESLDNIVDRIRRLTDVGGAQGAIHDAVRASEGLLRRFQNVKTRSPQDANQIIEFTGRILSAVPENDESRTWFLRALHGLFSMMAPSGNPTELEVDQSVRLAETVFSIAEPGAEQRISALSNLNTILRGWYNQTRDVQYIRRAITASEQAIEAIQGDSPHRAMLLDLLAISLGMLFEDTHDLDIAEHALVTAESAVVTAKRSGDVKGATLGSNTMARILGRRFEQTGMVADLDRAVNVLTERSPPSPQGDAENYVVGLGYLATLLGIRFEQQGDMTDLNASIRNVETVLQLMPGNHPDRPVQLYNGANRLAERAQHTGRVRDLNDAIAYGKQTLYLAPRNHPEWANWLGGLGRFFGMRFTMTGVKDDLRRAIGLSRQAARAVNSNDILTRAVLASVLSNLLLAKYHTPDGTIADLDEAIDVLGKILPDLPEAGPGRGALEHVLGDALRTRSLLLCNTTDLKESGAAFQRAWSCRNSPITVRIDGAIQVAEIAATQAHCFKVQDPRHYKYWAKASTYFDHAVNLLHALSPRYMENVNKQHMLKRFAGLGAHAAAAALNAKKECSYALQQLELGRGIIFGLTLDLRTDLSSLREKRPDWADQFSRLRDRLDSGHSILSLTGTWESGGQTRRQAERQLEGLLAQIRKEKGFERFLMQPTIEELQEAADPDPAVIVNVSSFRCDAFIVKESGISSLTLPHLHLKDIEENTKRLKDDRALPSVLGWLWSTAVRPILDSLGFDRPFDLNEPSWPHIWWIPVGAFSSLPLHAAGDYTKHSMGTTLDRVASSYSSSLKSLLAGHRQKISQNSSGPINALLVSMASTPRHPNLPYAEREVAILEELCPALAATPIRPPQRKLDILSELSTCEIFHFAGHGKSDAGDPSRSALLLLDWEKNPLTVEDLRNQKLYEKPPFLAYLSACSTGENRVLELIDEAIHLGYACQFAGFRHVIGTLWTVSDPFCVDVAREFYETICREGKTDVAVYRALHLALRKLRGVQISAKNRGSSIDLDHIEPSQGKETGVVASGVAHKGGGGGDDNGDSHSQSTSGSRKGEGVGGRLEPSMNWLWVPFVHFGV
jgi:tetratricopeptide (TPR) repeat protein